VNIAVPNQPTVHMMPRGRKPLNIEPEEFERLVRMALDGLPPEYRRLLKNIAVIVEEEPPRDVLDDLELETEDDLLGLYSGVARGQESFFDTGAQLPARVSIYRGPILRLCRTADEVVQEVRDTVVHEIGHHFGLDDDDMPY
jgi:predicted Zn-dependent protease with MMP-like domain